MLFVVVSLLFCSTYVRAQDDVAKAAQEERARKPQQQANAPHVYTEEDLKRDKILVPADQARVEARKKRKTQTPGPQNAETLPLPADPNQQTESLGDIARRYRNEKAAREAAEAAEKHLAPFPYTPPKANPALAAPEPGIGPLNGNAVESPAPKHKELFPLAASRPSGPRARVSPFQPRPLPSGPAPVAPMARVAPVNPQPLTRGERPLIPNVAPSVELGDMRSIQVQRGDCWWRLAQRYLGSGARWPELRALNPATTKPQEFLREGSFILVPESARARTRTVQAGIIVKKGDTLWALARVHLGHGSAWSCLAKANPEVSDYSRLAIGAVLRLPSPETMKACEAPSSKVPKP